MTDQVANTSGHVYRYFDPCDQVFGSPQNEYLIVNEMEEGARVAMSTTMVG